MKKQTKAIKKQPKLLPQGGFMSAMSNMEDLISGYQNPDVVP